MFSGIIKLLLLSLSFLGLAAVASINTSNGYNLPTGVTPLSREIHELHMIVFWVCVVIGVGVFSVMGYSIVNHRKSKGYKAAQFHDSLTIEVLWTIIPLVVLIVIAVPATKLLIDLEDSTESDMTIKITGYQWKWKYDYIDGAAEGVGFFSNLDDRSRRELQASIELGAVPTSEKYLVDVDNELVVPVNKKIRFLVTSNDVIHSWWVPDFGVKQDAIPGFINDAWATIQQPGVYRGNCTELCGKDHAYMPIVVRALPEKEFEEWVYNRKNASEIAAAAANRSFTLEELVEKGKGVYDRSCAACHGATGAGVPGAFPAMTNSPIVLGDINVHVGMILNGVAGTAMQAFREQLSDVEIAAVVAYERNALGNSVGDFVQPKEVKAAR